MCLSSASFFGSVNDCNSCINKSAALQVATNAIVTAGGFGFAMLYPFKHRTEKYTLHLSTLHDMQQR
jgi:hypothetical protein